jgi:hypothetical protein
MNERHCDCSAFADSGGRGRTVGVLVSVGVNRMQVCTQRRIWIWASHTLHVLMEAGDRHLQRATQLPDRITSPFTRDDGVPHLDSLAKNAVAFFRMSRSIFMSRFSTLIAAIFMHFVPKYCLNCNRLFCPVNGISYVPRCLQ